MTAFYNLYFTKREKRIDKPHLCIFLLEYTNFPKYVLTVTYVQTNTPVDVCFHR